MVSADTPLIDTEVGEDTVTVRLDRPEKRNALNVELVAGLRTVLEGLHEDPGRGLLLTGSGPVTTAGADVSIVGGDDDERKRELNTHIDEVYRLLEGYPAPTVMAARGAAVGAGFQLAIVSDFAVLGEETVFHKPEIEYGVFSGFSTSILKHYFGAQIAKEIALAGREIEPERAHEWGMAADVVPESEVEDRARELLADLVGYDPGAYRATKEALCFDAAPSEFGNYP